MTTTTESQTLDVVKLLQSIDSKLKNNKTIEARKEAKNLYHLIQQNNVQPHWPSHPKAAAFYGKLLKNSYFIQHRIHIR